MRIFRIWEVSYCIPTHDYTFLAMTLFSFNCILNTYNTLYSSSVFFIKYRLPFLRQFLLPSFNAFTLFTLHSWISTLDSSKLTSLSYLSYNPYCLQCTLQALYIISSNFLVFPHSTLSSLPIPSIPFFSLSYSLLFPSTFPTLLLFHL